MLTLRSARKASAPYLPPPLLRFSHFTDAYFHLYHASVVDDYCGDEPSIAIVSAFFLAYIVLRSIQGLWVSTTRRSTAHMSGEENTVLGSLTVSGKVSTVVSNREGGRSIAGAYTPPPFQETVVILGSCNSGKTALLHYLCNPKEKENVWDPPVTVTSLVANVGYICPLVGTAGNANRNSTIRIIDYPGHPSLSSQLTTLLLPSTTSRLVFTLDATQPVTAGGALLYQSILTHDQVRQSWSKEKKTLVILVVFTKSDVKGAKNYKRMKIQLRNELDKLRKVDLEIQQSSTTNDNGAVNVSSKATLDVKGKTIDLDRLGADIPVSLHFVESGFGMNAGISGLEAVWEFILRGVLPNAK